MATIYVVAVLVDSGQAGSSAKTCDFFRRRTKQPQQKKIKIWRQTRHTHGGTFPWHGVGMGTRSAALRGLSVAYCSRLDSASAHHAAPRTTDRHIQDGCADAARSTCMKYSLGNPGQG